MDSQFSRTAILIGEDAVQKLNNSTVAVFGIGGVGGYVVEALARAGVQNFVLVDKDEVSITNLNRQIIATHSSIGKNKVDVMKERVLDINPNANVEAINKFFLPENSHEFDFSKYDYVVDAIDCITAKLEIIVKAKQNGKFIISAMGAGNKLSPQFEVADISKTSVCPLAKVMRKELKTRNITNVKVVFSKQDSVKPKLTKEYEELLIKENKRQLPGSISFVPSVMGLTIAEQVIKQLIEG